MEIKETLTIDDLVANRMDLIRKSDAAKRNIKKRRIMYSVFMVVGILLSVFSMTRKFSALALLGIAYSLWGLLEVVYAKRRYLHYNRKNLKRNMEITARQYGMETKEIESITKIEDDTIIMKELGTTTMYLKSDYVRNSENEKSYILEFTNGRFIFFKKDTFTTREHYQELIKEIQANGNA